MCLSGWEWRSAPLGECLSDFIYCNGMRPMQFQCQKSGTVFKDGECVEPSKANLQCGICKGGNLKRAEKCNEVSELYYIIVIFFLSFINADSIVLVFKI